MADFFYHSSANNPVINPNMWMWSPTCVLPGTAGANPPTNGLAGPAGSPTRYTLFNWCQ